VLLCCGEPLLGGREPLLRGGPPLVRTVRPPSYPDLPLSGVDAPPCTPNLPLSVGDTPPRAFDEPLSGGDLSRGAGNLPPGLLDRAALRPSADEKEQDNSYRGDDQGRHPGSSGSGPQATLEPAMKNVPTH